MAVGYDKRMVQLIKKSNGVADCNAVFISIHIRHDHSLSVSFFSFSSPLLSAVSLL